ncbi:MAG: PadR family transcriptional regulator [Ignisphaera sp.]
MSNKDKFLEIEFVLVNVRGLFKDLVLYALMKLGKAHGYAIKKFLSQTIKVYAPSSGILYPTLHELEKEGMLKSFIEKNRKIYTLTEKGNKYISNKAEEIEKTVKKLNRAIEIASYIGLKNMFEIIKELWNQDIEPPQEALDKIKSKITEIIEILNEILTKTPKNNKTQTTHHQPPQPTNR